MMIEKNTKEYILNKIHIKSSIFINLLKLSKNNKKENVSRWNKFTF